MLVHTHTHITSLFGSSVSRGDMAKWDDVDVTKATALGKMGVHVANIGNIEADTNAKMAKVRARARELGEKTAKLKAVVSSSGEEATKLEAKQEKARAEEAAKREEQTKLAEQLLKCTQEKLQLEARLRRLEAELAALQEEASVYEERIAELEGTVTTAKDDLETAQMAEREALAAKNAAEADLAAAEAALVAAAAEVMKAESELREAQLNLKIAEEELASKEEVLDVLYGERANAAVAHCEAVQQVKRLEAEVIMAQKMLQTFSVMKAAATAAAAALTATVVGAGVAAAIVASLAAMESMYQQQVETASQRLALAAKESHERDVALQQLNARVESAEKERAEAITAVESRNRDCTLIRELVDNKRQACALAEERTLTSSAVFNSAVRCHSQAAARVKVQAMDLEAAVASLQEVREKISSKESEIKNVAENLLAVATNAERDLQRDTSRQWSTVTAASLARVQVSRQLAKATATRDAAKFNLDASSMALDQTPAHMAALKNLQDKTVEAKAKLTEEQLDVISKAKERAEENSKENEEEKDAAPAAEKEQDKQAERDTA